MPYEIAVSSGLSFEGSAPPELKLGLGMKMSSITTYGVRFVQVDVQSPAEFTQPEFVGQVVQAKESLGLRWSMHAEISEYVAMDTALYQLWQISHERLHSYLDNLYEKFFLTKKEKYLPEFIDFHASQAEPIGIFPAGFRFRTNFTVDFRGRTDFTELMNEVPTLKNWFKKKVLPIIFPLSEFSVIFTRLIQISKKFVESILRDFEEFRKFFEELQRELETGEKRTIRDFDEIYRGLPEEKQLELQFRTWYEYTKEQLGAGTIQSEEAVYLVIGKYLEITNDELWKLFFGSKRFEDLEAAIEKASDGRIKLIDTERAQINLVDRDLIACVSAKYVLEHFKQPPLADYIRELEKRLNSQNRELDSFYKLSAFEKLNKLKVTIVFENPELSQLALPGRQRIVRANHIYNLVKAMRSYSKYFSILVDFEHYIHNAIDPIEELKHVPEDFGEFVKAVHVFHPVGLHIHLPIDVGSEEQRIIYSYLFLLRKTGFGKKEEAVLIFERGSGQNPGEFIRTSVHALRLITDQLDKDVAPDKLPLEFFGVSPEGFYSPERQRAIIRDHAIDPLKGLISIPEEEFTFLGKAATEKPGTTPEKWKKEELR